MMCWCDLEVAASFGVLLTNRREGCLWQLVGLVLLSPMVSLDIQVHNLTTSGVLSMMLLMVMAG